MIRIVLADDHSVVRMGFRMIIEQQMDLQVVGEASDPEEAFDLVVSEKPDVLLTDISMGTEKSGLLLAERVRDGGVTTRVVMLSMHDERRRVVCVRRHDGRVRAQFGEPGRSSRRCAVAA